MNLKTIIMRVIEVIDQGFADRIHLIMRDQGHFVPSLTHAIMVGDEVRGAYSSDFFPLVFVWFNLLCQLGQGLVVFKAVNHIKQHGLELGHSTMIWTMKDTVEPFKYAERVGLVYGGDAHWFASHTQNSN